METTFLNQSESIEQISQALSSAYGELTNAHNDAQGAFSNNYASLGTVVANGNRQVLARYGLAILQGLNQVSQVSKEIEDRHPMGENQPDKVTVTREFQPFWQLVTRIQHSSGEYIEFPSPLPMEDGGRMSATHKFISAVTYMRRATNGMIINVATDNDDDGNAASNITEPQSNGRASRSTNRGKAKSSKSKDTKAESNDGKVIGLPSKDEAGERLEAESLEKLRVAMSATEWQSQAQFKAHVRLHWDHYKSVGGEGRLEELQALVTEMSDLLAEKQTA